MCPALETAPREDFEAFLDRQVSKELLRFTTAGSVDDGKSTLIGRLLHDAKAVYEDQLASVRNSPINRSGKALDFSLLTDGLRAEREQGITIDVAYRYFSTPRRKFIIADTPGHEQYTRNMATGASTADLAIILLDATKGVLPQTRRHAYIASLLGIPGVLAAINKMDLVDYREEIFSKLQHEFSAMARTLRISHVQCIPISALEGDNVVRRGPNMPWYFGPTLMQHLETAEIPPERESSGVRFPIQFVIRPDASFRGFAGRVASGTIRPGDTLLALPSQQRARVKAVLSYRGQLGAAIPAQSVVLKLEDEIDLSRGDMLVSAEDPPHQASSFAAMVVWLHAEPLTLGRLYLARHAGREVKAQATRIRFRININDLTEDFAQRLEMNEIGFVEFATSSPLFFDSYGQNRTTGSLILIDPISNATVGAAMIREELSSEPFELAPRTPVVQEEAAPVTQQQRSERRGHFPAVLLVDGDGAFAEILESRLFARGFDTILIRQEDLPAAVHPAFLSALRSAGLLVVLQSAEVSPQYRAELRQAAREFFFDCSASMSPGSTDDRLARALVFAERLRLKFEFRGESESGVKRHD